MAYQSDEAGRDEVYVRPFPGAGGVWQISNGGGISPRWSADGKELYYIAPGNNLMAAAIAAKAGSITPGQPVVLFTTNITGLLFRPQYGVSRNGQFLINLELADAAAAPITLLQHWKPPK